MGMLVSSSIGFGGEPVVLRRAWRELKKVAETGQHTQHAKTHLGVVNRRTLLSIHVSFQEHDRVGP